MMLFAVLAVGMMTMLVMPAYAAAPGSPRDQFNSGIPLEMITCDDGKILMQSSSGKPYCMDESTAVKLADRGFTVVVVVVSEVKTNHTYATAQDSVSFEGEDATTKKELERVVNAGDFISDDLLIEQKVGTEEEEEEEQKEGTKEEDEQKEIDIQEQSKETDTVLSPPVTTQTVKKSIPDLIYDPGPQEGSATLKDIVPQDITFDYVLRMPPTDHDLFAQRMVEFFDDKITETKRDEYRTLYTTERGWIEIMHESLVPATIRGGTDFMYTFYGPGRINPSQAESVTFALLEELGIKLDGTELYREGHGYVNYDYQIVQTKGDLLVLSNKIITKFDAGYTFIFIGSWNDNLSDMALYDIQRAEINARAHIFKYDELTGPDCDVRFMTNHQKSFPTSLYVINGRPIYQVYSGTCQIQIWADHFLMFSTYVDAITGKPLFIDNKPIF